MLLKLPVLSLSPVLAVVFAVLLALTHVDALMAAGPILFLWALAPATVSWLNSPPLELESLLRQDDENFLLRQALLVDNPMRLYW